MEAERTFRAMGTTARVIVTADSAEQGERLIDAAVARIEDLEARWSRFRPTSELCRLNAAAGRTAVVSAETFALVSKAVDAWFLTDGRFDPTILPALIDAGYDRTFEEVRHLGPATAEALDEPDVRVAPGCAEIRLGEGVHSVTLPVGVELDLGGIGKGYVADLVAVELLGRGARGACVNLGGDMRVIGEPPWDEGWLVEVEHPLDPEAAEPVARLALTDGAVVTTTRAKRQWTRNGVPAHHIIDPATGRPAQSGLASVTVVAGEAWWGEVFAKAAFIAGPVHARHVLAQADVTGFLVDDAGTVHRAARLEAFAR